MTTDQQTRTKATAPSPAEPSQPLPAWVYPAAVAAVALVLYLFQRWSRGVEAATKSRGWFEAPPVYGDFDPTWSKYGYVALGVAVCVGLLASLVVSRRVPGPVFLALTVAAATGLAFAVNLVRGDPEIMLRSLCPQQKCGDYGTDVALLREAGVREFVSSYPDVYRPLMTSVHNRTHPPGALVVWNWLVETFGGRFGAAFATAAITMTAVAAAWLMARTIGGERAGRLAALLAGTAPSMLLYAFTSMDGLYAAMLSLPGALLLLAVHRRLWWLAGVAGFAIGLASFVTYAAVFIAMAGAVATLVLTRNLRAVVTLLGSAAVGGLLALALLYVACGFDLLASNATVSRVATQPRPMWYWAWGGPAAFLICAGVMLAGLGLVGLAARRPPMSVVLILGMCVFAALPRTMTGLYPGEVERTWLFLVPFLATAGGLAWSDWERVSRLVRRAGVPVFIAFAGGNAVLIQALYDTRR